MAVHARHGLKACFMPSPYKAFDLNNPTSTTRTDVNRDGNFLQLAGTFRGWSRSSASSLGKQKENMDALQQR
jgi:hypothetical protein